jgi:hypothetical protein
LLLQPSSTRPHGFFKNLSEMVPSWFFQNSLRDARAKHGLLI